MRAWAMALLACLSGCTHLFFQPMPAHVRTPADLGLAHEDVRLRSADGVALHAWFLPAAAPAEGTVLFLHGNAENISTHIGAVAWLPARHFNVLLLDYRGYGRSEGTPSVDGALLDIDAALSHLIGRADVDARRITVFGQSLGGALAILAVAQSPRRDAIRALVTDSAFSDFRGIAREKLRSRWFLLPFATPLSWTISDRHRPLESVARITPIPLFIIHGEDDSIVPAAHARALFSAAGEPRQLRIYAGAGHIASLRQPQAREDFLHFLQHPETAIPGENASQRP